MQRLLKEFRRHRALYFVWLIWFGAFVLLVRATLGGPDGNRYMAYMHSLVFDHDLMLVNELQYFGQRVIITATGYSAQIANVGIIPFWLPFYLMGMLSALLNGNLGTGLGSNYALWLDFGDWVYGLMAALLIYRWACKRHARAIALASTLLVCLGTSYWYYASALAPSYHAVSALLCTLYLYLWDATRQSRSWLQWVGLGVLAGLLISIAQYHAALLVFILFDWRMVIDVPPLQALLSARPKLPALHLHLTPLLMLPALVLPFIPQFIAWGIIFGNPFANPYTLESDWSGAHLPDVLFSSYHGLFFTAPILAIAVMGWFLAWRNDRALGAGALTALLAIAYSSATRISWWAGVSFGARYFIGLSPLFVLGLAETLRFAQKRLPHRMAAGIWLAAGTICVLWTYGFYLQAMSGIASFSEYSPRSRWLANQVSVLQHAGELLTAYWLAPRSTWLIQNLAGFALYSLAIVRVAGAWLVAGRPAAGRGWIVALALVPAVFGLYLTSTIGPGEQQKQALAAGGYYEQNLARAQFDFEQFSNEYVENAKYHEITGQPDALRRDIQRALALWPVKTRQLVDEAAAGDYQPLNLKFGDHVTLAGYQVLDANDRSGAVPGYACGSPPARCAVRIRLLWRSDAWLKVDYDAGVLLLEPGGNIAARTKPTLGLDPFPLTWWPPHILLSDEHVIDAGSLAKPQLLRVRVELFDAQANKRLTVSDDALHAANGVIGEIKLESVPGAAEGQSIATLGGKVSLLGYQLNRSAPNRLDITLKWRADAVMNADYTVFVHALDRQGRMLAQNDSQPRSDSYPTHAWSPGEIVADPHTLTAEPALLDQIDHFAIGLYTLADGKRLPNPAGGDTILLNPVTK